MADVRVRASDDGSIPEPHMPAGRRVSTCYVEPTASFDRSSLGRPAPGKSTALRMLAGLEEVDEGAVLIGGRDVTVRPAEARYVVMVFQQLRALPLLSVAVVTSASRSGSCEVVQGRARPAGGRPRGRGSALYRVPRAQARPALRGQRQRVALHRFVRLAGTPATSLDLPHEPLSNLDAQLRVH